ncbi:hypothetical protein ABT213_28560 [Streptomyces sp. NPDC001674]|uniref:hypothetical protein n=1 Tax=Streptomyces sp. NPDC001674 TaxID=3154394 RepID=UPI0033258197
MGPADVRAGWRAVLWGARGEGGIAVLLVQERFLTWSYGVWRVAAACDAEVVFLSGEGTVQQRVPLYGVEACVSHFAVLPGNRFLLVKGRSRQAEDGSWEPNAEVYAADGGRERSFCVGDDIPALVTDRHGGIWTAYGDEGVYGHHPESGGGLAGWNGKGAARWAPGGRLPSYPLEGLTGATEKQAVWLAWYSHEGTYLSRITPADGDVTTYPSPVRKLDGLAVRGNRAVLSRRDHGEATLTLTRAELAGGAWTVTGQERLRMPGQVWLGCGQGRDGVLWLRAGDSWVRFEV